MRLIAALGLLLVPADSALATEDLGRVPDPQVLQGAGVQVTWPLQRTTATLEPGAPVRVVIRRRANVNRPGAARIALTRISRSGRVMRVLAVRRLRAGTFTARLTEPPGSRYRLSLVVAGGWFWGLIDTVAPPPVTVSPSQICQSRTMTPPTAQLTLDRAAARSGEPITATVHNTGESCLRSGTGSEYQRLAPDGSWQPLPVAVTLADLGSLAVPAGQQVSTSAAVPASATPGRYRIRKTVNSMIGDVGFSVDIYAELDVTA